MSVKNLDWLEMVFIGVLIFASILVATNVIQSLKRKVVRLQLGGEIVSVDRLSEPKSFWFIVFLYIAWLGYVGYLLVAFLLRSGVQQLWMR